MASKLEQASDLLDAARPDWKDIGGPVAEDDVLRAESMLSLGFPDEYRNFVLRYGLGGIGGTEIYGVVDGGNLDDPTPPNVVGTNQDSRKNGLPKDLLAFEDGGDGGQYCVDLRDGGGLGIVVWHPDADLSNLELGSASFGAHLLTRLKQSLANLSVRV